jgi:hypothetical protein
VIAVTIHAREDEADSDFEWVNTWAAAAAVQAAPAVAPVGGPAEVAGARPFGSADVACGVSSMSAAARPAAGPEDFDAEQAQAAAVPLLETARRRKRWTHLFRIIARASETESSAEPGLPTLDAPQAAPSQAAGRTHGAGEEDGAAMRGLTQIERDVAEIERVRDRLLSEFAPARRRTADRNASARTSDYVPIVVGGVIAFTSLVVFGAAALFVSLR